MDMTEMKTNTPMEMESKKIRGITLLREHSYRLQDGTIESKI